MNGRQRDALRLLQAGLSVIPIRPDGTKAPCVKWERYQHEPASELEVMRWFSSMHSGVGIIGGMVSGGLEILDFDDAEVFEPWRNLVNQLYEGVTNDLPMVQTPTGGFHLYYRAHEVTGNQKLARRRVGDVMEVRIETRGEGGYVLSPYGHTDCHPLRCGYRVVHGDLTQIPLISLKAREVLLNSAKAFDEVIDPPKKQVWQPRREVVGDRPGDRFSASHTWGDILEPHGWQAVQTSGGCTLWRRPGKDAHGWSARTGYKGYDTLRVFSTNAQPFEENRAYSKFSAYTLLNFHGDFHASAKALGGGR